MLLATIPRETCKTNPDANNDSSEKYFIDIPTGQKLDANHKHQITTIAATGKQNKLKTYLNQPDLMEMVASGDYDIKAVFNDETTQFLEGYLGRIVDLDAVPKNSVSRLYRLKSLI